MSRRVYVLNDGGHDYSAASEFGEVVICTSGAISKSDINYMWRMLSEHLENADKGDLILISSLTSLCSVASAIMAAQFGEVHFLVYTNGRYIIKDLML